MHFAFLHLIHVAEIYEQLVGLVEGHSHGAKVLDEFGELIEYEVGVFGSLLVELLLLGLHQSLDLALESTVELSKSLFQSGNLLVLSLSFLLALLSRGATQCSALSPLESYSLFPHAHLESLLNAFSPGASVTPNAMVDQVKGDRLFPAVILEVEVLGTV